MKSGITSGRQARTIGHFIRICRSTALLALACLSLLARPATRCDAQIEISQTINLTPGMFLPDGTPVLDVYTWSQVIGVRGTNWMSGLPVAVFLVGPLNMPGVPSVSRFLDNLFPDTTGKIQPGIDTNPSITIPFNYGLTFPPTIPRPGVYELSFVQKPNNPFQAPLTVVKTVSVCPRTVPVFNPLNILWPEGRGARSGILGDLSPELTDPEWLSVWSEKPVGFYGTVADTGADGGNQPSHIAYHDVPWTHFAHDFNIDLIPDKEYLWVLGDANFTAFQAPETVSLGRLEVEWELQNDQSPLLYDQGQIGMPLFVAPTTGDRVFVVGRWVMDNGHPEAGLRTEIHPAKMLATIRKRNTAAPLAPTGILTRASQVDVFVSGHGGGANVFPDELSKLMDGDGDGGGEIFEGLTRDQLAIYGAYGPASSSTIDLIVGLISGCLCDQIKSVAGPSGLGFVNGHERRDVNDMDYDFDVPLPTPPAGAKKPRVQVITQPSHATTVTEVVTFTNPSPTTHLPTTAHVHLPCKGADSRVYARTLKFFWDGFNPPGEHYVVTMNDMSPLPIAVPPGATLLNPPRWNLWTDVSGQWSHLGSPSGLTERWGGNFAITGPPTDVFLDPADKLRIYMHGYEVHDAEALFGGIGKRAYDAGLELLETVVRGTGDNANLGGALFNGTIGADLPSDQIKSYHVAATPIGYAYHINEGGIVVSTDPKKDFFSPFRMDFTIAHVNSPPRLKVTGAPVGFGKVCLGSSLKKTVRLTNLGEDTLTINNIVVSGGGFSNLSTSAAVIQTGAFVDVIVQFKPTDVTQGAGTLSFQTNDPLQPSPIYNLKGTVGHATITATANTSRTPSLVVGTTTTWLVTIANSGTCPLRVKPSITGAGFSIVLPSSYYLLGQLVKDIVVPPGGTNTDLVVKFVCPFVSTKFVGTLSLHSNDPLNPTPTLVFGAEGVPVGMRVLVVGSDGAPYPSVDDIRLTNPSLTVNTHLKNAALTTIDPPDSWKRIQYHYMTALQPTIGDGVYELRVQVGNKKQTLTFALAPDEFKQLVILVP